MVDHIKQSHLFELVGNISDHNGGSLLLSIKDLVEVDIIVVLVMSRTHRLALLLLSLFHKLLFLSHLCFLNGFSLLFFGLVRVV